MSTIGGGIIKELSFSKAWGTNPSAASGVALLDLAGGSGSFSMAVGDYVVFAFGSLASFPGIVTDVSEAVSFGQGREQTFQIADNRIRLNWQVVFGAWNIEDDVLNNHSSRPVGGVTGSDVSVGGTDAASFGGVGVQVAAAGIGVLLPPSTPWEQRRRYKHLLPVNWSSGLWTYSDEPLTAREILNSAFNGAWGDFGFTRNYHSALDSAVLTGMDYSTGIRLSNLISEINGKCGLDLTISGARTLIWGRKGEGLPPLPDAYSTPLATGSSLTSVDSAVRVVGERIRMQRLNLTLEPDWKEGWNAWIDELAWMREVATVFSKPTATKSDLLDLAAFARQVTVYEYAKAKGEPGLLDTRPFGRVSRARLPAWVYVRELVYRSYRIPPEFKLHGVPLSSLEFGDGLLCQTDISGSGLSSKQIYARDPIQFYPAVQVSAIARGQPLDLISAREIRLFYRNSSRDLRNEWTNAPDFEVDSVGKSIRFSVPTFIDGDFAAGESIYHRVNKGEGGGEDITALVPEGSDYLDVVAPNPDFQIAPAEVRISAVFVLGARYFKDYGVGPRRGNIASSGLDLHVLDLASDTGFASSALGSLTSSTILLPEITGTFKELLYNDGGTAASKADALAEAALELSTVQSTGGFTRNGIAGTLLTPVVDRITLSIRFGAGVVEQVEYTKARATSVALAERTLQRIQRSEELFSGQDALKREMREYRLMAAAERRPALRSRARSHNTFTDVFSMPVGSESPSVTTLYEKVVTPAEGAPPAEGDPPADPDAELVWKAGDIVWVDGAGAPSAKGKAVGGILVSTPVVVEESGFPLALPVATHGTVPMRVRGPILAGASVYAAPGRRFGVGTSTKGGKLIGKLAHGADVPVDEAAVSGEEISGPIILAMVHIGAGSGTDLRYAVSFSESSQRIYVAEGSVAWVDLTESSASSFEVVHPEIPTLDDVSLTEQPFWEVGSEADGGEGLEIDKDYEIRVVIKNGGSYLVIEEAGSDSGDAESEGDPQWVVAIIRFKEFEGDETKLALDKIEPLWQSDIPWYSLGGSSSSSSGSGGSASTSSESDSSDSGSSELSSGGESGGGESEKSSNAIVRMPWHESEWGALATIESNEVLFQFAHRGVPICGRVTRIPIDPRFRFVCEPGSLELLGMPVGAGPFATGAEVVDGVLVLRTSILPWRRPKKVNYMITGVRRGFLRWNMPARTEMQAAAAEASNRAQYPRNDGEF